MTKKEFHRLRSIYFAMYDRTKSAFWFDKVKELTRKYEEENDYRRFDGYIKIHYPDGSEYLYRNLDRAGDQFKLSGAKMFDMARAGKKLKDGTFFTLEEIPKKNRFGVTFEYPDGCIKEFLSVASASKAIGFSIDTISRYKNSDKLLLGEIKVTTLLHEEL